MSYDSRPDTRAHIQEVQYKIGQVVKDLLRRSDRHDQSKLEEPEVSVFDEFSSKLKESTYGSEEYKGFLEGMGEGLKHHYAVNDHHPEHFRGIACEPSGRFQGDIILPRDSGVHGMNLIQMLEMLCDWKAATMRHDNGDLRKSIEYNAERFGYGDEIKKLLLYTAAYLGWL